MSERGGDFGERGEDEAALGQARMRYDEVAGADGGAGVEEDVNVEGARAVVEAQAAAELMFDGLSGVEKLQRNKKRFGGNAAVEKPRLRSEADWLGGVERGTPEDADAGSVEEFEGAGEVSLAVAEVGTEGEVDFF